MSHFCSKCGTKVFENSIFCEYCGNKLKAPNFSQSNIQLESRRKFVHSSAPKVYPRRSSPDFYTYYNKTPSHRIKWLFIAVFFIMILGFAISVAVFCLISLMSISNDHSNYNQQPINEVDFSLLDYSLTTSQPGVMQVTVTIQNNGDIPATSGLVPISWEDSFFEILLTGGVGLLDENVVGFDLNGNGNTLDTFSVTWFYNETRQWDAIINDGFYDIHAYSIFEGPVGNPGIIRTYYINEQAKLFQLGNLTHSLYMADNDRAWFGLGNVSIMNHPGPCFELFVNSRINITDFEINGEVASVDYTRTLVDYIMSGPWTTTVYIISIPAPGVWPGGQVCFSCTLTSDSSMTSDIFLFMNWSPDGKTRKIWLPFEQLGVSL